MPTARDRAAASGRNTPGRRAAARYDNWRDHAACGHADPDLFFPISTDGPALRQVEEAKRICQACPARTPCLDWALHHDVAAGVWGGTTEEERHVLRKALVRERSSA